MHFVITEKLTTDCVSLYNNARLISKVFEKDSQRKRWKLLLSTTWLSFDAPPQGTSETIRIYLIPSETTVIGLHFCCRYGSTFIQMFVVNSERCIFFCNRVRIGRFRSSKVVDFCTNRNGACIHITLMRLLIPTWISFLELSRLENYPSATGIKAHQQHSFNNQT